MERETRNILITVVGGVILFIIITTVLIVNWNSSVEKERNACKNIGGTYQVIDKQYDASTSTYVDVYGCIK
jgi:hypothetical protein